MLINRLTATESKVYSLNGIGKQTKEIADIMQSSYETSKSHMKNIKTKLGLSKDKEVTAHFWCNLVGKDFDEVKKQIIASCLLITFLAFIPFEQQHQMREARRFCSRSRTGVVVRRNELTI